jgi:thioredoxin 1
MGILEKIFGKPIKEQLPISLNDDNFDDVVMMSEMPVVVDVWGERCAPCKKLEPIMMKLAGEYDEQVKVCELNASKNPQTAVRLKVRSTPTVLYYRPKGHLVERVHGFRGRLYHEEIIETELLRNRMKADAK